VRNAIRNFLDNFPLGVRDDMTEAGIYCIKGYAFGLPHVLRFYYAQFEIKSCWHCHLLPVLASRAAFLDYYDVDLI